MKRSLAFSPCEASVSPPKPLAKLGVARFKLRLVIQGVAIIGLIIQYPPMPRARQSSARFKLVWVIQGMVFLSSHTSRVRLACTGARNSRGLRPQLSGSGPRSAMGIAMVVSWRRAEAGLTDAPGSWAMRGRSQLVGALLAVWSLLVAIWQP